MNQIIDTRDLQERIEELESQLEDVEEEIDELNEQLEDIRNEISNLEFDSSDPDLEEEEVKDIKIQILKLKINEEELDDEIDTLYRERWEVIVDELGELSDLRSEIPEWYDGNALILESYWIDYVQDLLEDCGDLPRDIPWYIVIDWEATAENIAVDYSTCEYQGNTYYYRNC